MLPRNDHGRSNEELTRLRKKEDKDENEKAEIGIYRGCGLNAAGIPCRFRFCPVHGADKGPIKIGYLAPFTGTWAQAGQDMVVGAKLFLESINYTVAGRKIELIIEDEGAAPSTAITKARKLINHDKVNFVTGVWLSSAAYAVAPIFEEAGVPLIVSPSAGDDLTQRKRSKTGGPSLLHRLPARTCGGRLCLQSAEMAQGGDAWMGARLRSGNHGGLSEEL